MKSKGFWLNMCLLNLCTLTLLGLVLRTKMLFEIPFVDYNHLLKVHSNFAFEGWVTLTLMVLFVNELLNENQRNKIIYQVIFWAAFILSWLLILTLEVNTYAGLITYISFGIILFSYVFSWVFIKDIFKTNVNRSTKLFAVSGLIYLVLSSGGPIALSYLFATKSLDGVLYRNALFSYLHLQYNGYFTLAVFALLFHKLESKLNIKTMQGAYLFAMVLAISVLPSMFLSYHWSDPNNFVHIVAYIGSILSLVTLGIFLTFFPSLIKVFKNVRPLLRFMGMLSIGSFMAKMFFQSFTIFNVIGNPVFGDRPIIMGFLHLVFLGFISLFLLAYLTQTGILNKTKNFTNFALLFFTFGIIANLTLLWTQGVGAMFIKSSPMLPWLLWGAGIWLFVGAVLLLISRAYSKEIEKV